MSMITALAVAIVALVVQQVLLQRAERRVNTMHNTIVGITLGDIETKLDGADILIRKVRN